MEYVIIMAGGTGKRLWPLSRQGRPKQVLKIIEGDTLLRRCYQRLEPIFDSRNIIVLTNASYCDTVRDELPELPYENVIAEPAVRDTAGAVGLAAAVLSKYDPDATMAVVTADQLLKPTEVFQQAIQDALCFVNANPDSLVTFGIEPSFPSTQLGYIKLGKNGKCPNCTNEVYAVDAFKEKPDVETASKYLAAGKYCWNSGMFIWKAKTILDELYKNLPQAQLPLKKIQTDWGTAKQEQTLMDYFPKLPKISIDFAVMEKAKNVHAIRLNCQWLDMGSFSALADIINADGNGNTVIAGVSELLNCKNNVIATEDNNHLIACIGLKNMTIVHTQDATLVCPTDEAERLKQLLELIRSHNGEEFL